MDKVLVEFKNAENESIYIEIDPETAGNKTFISSGDSLIKAASSFERAMAPVVTMANKVIEQVKKIERPDTVELEFGIKLSAEMNIFAVAATGEGSINIKLTWKAKEEKEKENS